MDQTAKMIVANRAGLLTHDLRAFMRTGINIVNEIENRKKKKS